MKRFPSLCTNAAAFMASRRQWFRKRLQHQSCRCPCGLEQTLASVTLNVGRMTFRQGVGRHHMLVLQWPLQPWWPLVLRRQLAQHVSSLKLQLDVPLVVVMRRRV